ncbi:MAG: cyclic nucleotide-binding/CBS domain-containing protein [Promethearchaeota archaeon]
MLIKHVKNIDIEDEFIRVNKNDTIFEIAKKLKDIRKERVSEAESEELICIPILAAYVIEKGEPIGVIYEEDIINKVIIKGYDAKVLKAKDVMKPPICCSIHQEARDAINQIIDNGLLTLAVCDGNQLVSVISVFDAIFLNEQLDDI